MKPDIDNLPSVSRTFRRLVMFLTFVSVVIVGVLGTTASPALVPLLGLVLIMVMATHREAFFADETALSGSFIVELAAVVAAAELKTPMLFAVSAVFAGLHVAHIRSRAWSRLLVNASVHVIAAALAAAAYVGWTALGEGWFVVLVGLCAATLVYWFTNNMILAVVIGTFEREPIVRLGVNLIRSETEMLLFAVAGAGCGYLIAHESRALGLFALVLLLVAVDVLVIRRPRFLQHIGDHSVQIRDGVQIAIGVIAIGATGAVLLVAPLPSSGPLVLLTASAVVTAVVALRGFRHQRVAIIGLAPLVAVGAFQGPSAYVGTALVALAAGLTLAVAERGATRRPFAIGQIVLPALAAAAIVSWIPLSTSDGWLSIAVLALAATVGAAIAQSVVVGLSIAPRVGVGGLFVAIGDAFTDIWLVLAGAAAMVAGAGSAIAGVAVVGVVVAAAAILERRRPAPAPPVSKSLGRDELVDAIAAAIVDRPGAPTSLPS